MHVVPEQQGGCLPCQVVDSLMGGVDGSLLERLAKIMSYMRPSVGGKPGKRLKRKDKLQMLGQTTGLPPLAGIGALKASRTNGSVSLAPVVICLSNSVQCVAPRPVL